MYRHSSRSFENCFRVSNESLYNNMHNQCEHVGTRNRSCNRYSTIVLAGEYYELLADGQPLVGARIAYEARRNLAFLSGNHCRRPCPIVASAQYVG